VRLILLCLLPALVMPSASAGESTPAALPKLQDPPRIDGVIDPAEWRGAMEVTGFHETNRNLAAAGIPESLRTEAYVAQTDSAFCFAFRCYHDRMRQIYTAATEHDGPVWADDSVEIFLDAHGTRYSYYHIIVNAAGCLTDAFNRAPKRRDATWDADTDAAASLRAESFEVEVRVPFETLNLGLNRDGTIGLNLCRNVRYTIGRQSWRGGFHDPANAAMLRVAGVGPKRFPIAVRSASWGELAGDNEVCVEIENLVPNDIALEGRLEILQGSHKVDRSFRHEALPGKTFTLRLPYRLAEHESAHCRLTLRDGAGRVVAAIPRILRPKAIASVTINSDLLLRTDTARVDVQLNVPRSDLKHYQVTVTLRDRSGREMLRRGPIVPKRSRFQETLGLSAAPPEAERLVVHTVLENTQRKTTVVDSAIPLTILSSPWAEVKP